MSTQSDITCIVFNIQRFCLNDGPGIRTTVFLKGCPLHCLWCHNPESNSFAPEILLNTDKCIGCGTCFRLCENHVLTEDRQHLLRRNACIACGKCAQGCMAGGITVAGKTMSISEVMRECEEDAVFYGTDGGITLSGGEPLSQSEFTIAILRAARDKGFSTAIETSGFCSVDVMEAAACLTDTFLYDYKETDPILHKRFTGHDNVVILHNLDLLEKRKANVVLRCPIVPGYNDREEHFAGIGAVANRYSCIDHVEVEPFHDLGKSKAKQLDKEYAVSGVNTVNAETTAKWIECISSYTGKKVKKG